MRPNVWWVLSLMIGAMLIIAWPSLKGGAGFVFGIAYSQAFLGAKSMERK